jgi:hypothetical protein
MSDGTHLDQGETLETLVLTDLVEATGPRFIQGFVLNATRLPISLESVADSAPIWNLTYDGEDVTFKLEDVGPFTVPKSTLVAIINSTDSE